MRQKFILTIIIVIFNLSGKAAERCIITGNVVNSNLETLPYATVILKNLDNQNTIGNITDDKGYFCFMRISAGRYQLSVSFVGYSAFHSEVFETGETEEIELPDIILEPKTRDLAEVIVTGRARVSEIKPTYIKYKTNALISQSGGNAGDILKNMPSVAMGGSPGHNRDIRFRGLGNAYTKVLVNGRETGLKGNNRESILDQIPASSIQHIEILSVPGVEYETEGINGIVNIILKEDHNFGTKGEAEILTGNYDGLSGGAGLSHKTGKLNIYTRYDFQQRKLPKTKDKIKTDLKNGEISGREDNLEFEEKKFNNQSVRAGFDYNLFPKTRFSAEYIYGYQLEEKEKTNDVSKFDGSNRLKSKVEELRTETKPNHYHQAITAFNHTFEGNQQFKAGFNFVNSIQDKHEEKQIFNVDENGQWLDFQPKLENRAERKNTDEYHWNTGLSNVKIFSQNMQFGYTGKSESSRFGNIIDKYSYKDTAWASSAKGNDNFKVKETTQAFYAATEFHHSFLRAKAGLRYEFTNLSNNAENSETSVAGNYTVFIPNLSLTANIDETQYVTVNFGRRIRRPGFKDLNPFEEEKETGWFKKGNPNLKPELAWAYELGYLKNFNKFNVGTNIFYRDIQNVIQKTLTETDEGVVFETPENTGRAWLAGIEFMSSVKPVSFYELNASYSVFRSEITSGEYEGDALKDQFKWSAKAINDFILPWQTNLQLSLNAVGPKISGTKEENTIWFADFGLEKKLVRGGSFIFTVSDIFNSLKKTKTEYTDYSNTFENETTMGRIFLAGIKYRF